MLVERSAPSNSALLTDASRSLASECPAKASPRKLASGLETEYRVYVPCSLAHRARWIVGQLPVSDEELESLALRASDAEKNK